MNEPLSRWKKLVSKKTANPSPFASIIYHLKTWFVVHCHKSQIPIRSTHHTVPSTCHNLTLRFQSQIYHTATMISQLSFLTEPSPDINYNFISGIYALFSILALALYLLESYVLTGWMDSKEDDGSDGTAGISESLKEFAEGMTGLYWIFVPFLPCLFWSLYIGTKQSPPSLYSNGKKNN